MCFTCMSLDCKRKPQFLEGTGIDAGEPSPGRESNLQPFFFSLFFSPEVALDVMSLQSQHFPKNKTRLLLRLPVLSFNELLAEVEPCSINREEMEVCCCVGKTLCAPAPGHACVSPRINLGAVSQTPPASQPRHRQNKMDMTWWVVRDKG